MSHRYDRWQAGRRWRHHRRYHCNAPRFTWPEPKRTPRWVVILVTAVLIVLWILL